MDFYNIYLSLCVKNNISPSRAAKDMGFTSPTVTRWKSGSIPNDVTLMKIANYFDVSMEYLKTGQEQETKKDQPAEIDKLANTKVKQRLLEYLDTLPDEKIIALLTLIKNDEQ